MGREQCAHDSPGRRAFYMRKCGDCSAQMHVLQCEQGGRLLCEETAKRRSKTDRIMRKVRKKRDANLAKLTD